MPRSHEIERLHPLRPSALVALNRKDRLLYIAIGNLVKCSFLAKSSE